MIVSKDTEEGFIFSVLPEDFKFIFNTTYNHKNISKLMEIKLLSHYKGMINNSYFVRSNDGLRVYDKTYFFEQMIIVCIYNKNPVLLDEAFKIAMQIKTNMEEKTFYVSDSLRRIADFSKQTKICINQLFLYDDKFYFRTDKKFFESAEYLFTTKNIDSVVLLEHGINYNPQFVLSFYEED